MNQLSYTECGLDLLLTVAGGSYYTLHDGGLNLIFDRSLLVASSSDEELILDVYEMLAVLDDLAVGVLNRTVGRDVVRPFGRIARNLAVRTASLR